MQHRKPVVGNPNEREKKNYGTTERLNMGTSNVLLPMKCERIACHSDERWMDFGYT